MTCEINATLNRKELETLAAIDKIGVGKMFETDLPHWCAFSGAYDCPIRNKDDAYCKESLLKGYCKRKHDEAAEKALEVGE